MTHLPRRFESKVLETRQLSETGYELTLERNTFQFDAGRLVTLHGQDPTEDRSYTVCSGEQDEHIKILYVLIPTGKLTPQLVTLKEGDSVSYSGPYGEFVVRDLERPLVFIATGTGIAPCRAYHRSHPELAITLVHGARIVDDLFYRDEFQGLEYHPCVSREEGDAFHGRVTDFCETQSFAPGSHYYLCGANEMIFDMHRNLRAKGIEDDSIFTEAYYYRSGI